MCPAQGCNQVVDTIWETAQACYCAALEKKEEGVVSLPKEKETSSTLDIIMVLPDVIVPPSDDGCEHVGTLSGANVI